MKYKSILYFDLLTILSSVRSYHYNNSINNPKNAFLKTIEENKNASLLNQALLFEIKTEIPGAQTWRIDRCGYAHAVEMREPFLDYELAQFSLSIPPNLKINQENGINKKYILQKLATKFLPEKTAKRKKFPWGIPFYDFFIKEFLPLAESAIENSFKEKRPYLVNSKSYANNLFQNIYTRKMCQKQQKYCYQNYDIYSIQFLRLEYHCTYIRY